MFTSLFQFVVAILVLVLWCLILFFVVRAAINSAMASTRQINSQQTSLLVAQTDLLAQLTKHLTAQTDLMLVQARHDGITDEQLSVVLPQVAERKADPAFAMPFA
jgi:hypothetical protein